MKDEKLLLEKLSLKDKMILLDERRIQFDSKGFANKLQYFKCQGFKHFLFGPHSAFGNLSGLDFKKTFASPI